MKTAPRRRTRLRSSQYAAGRWKPSPAVAAVVVGLLLGFGLGLAGRAFDRSASLQEHYMLLVSDMYAQGVPLGEVRDRLLHLGYSDPSIAVVGVADQLAASSDTGKKQEADQLHQFAAALAAASVPDVNPTIIVRATPTSVPPAATPTPVLTLPAIAPVDVSSPTPVAPPVDTGPAASAPATAAPTPPPPATPTAPGKTGVVRSADRQPVLYRRDPTAKSAAIGILPYGSTVTIKGIVQGEAVEANDARWYRVSVNGHEGYIYAKYVQVGG